MRLFFDPDLAASYREMTARLARVASGDHALRRLASEVAERYATALLSNAEQREQMWRRFTISLNAFISLAPLTPSSDYFALREILTENVDLLEREAQAV